MKEILFDDLAKELNVDIEYDSQKEVAVIRSTVGTMTTYFGVPLSEEIRADEPEEAVKKKIRKVIGVGKSLRNTPVSRRFHNDDGGHRDGGRTEKPVRHEAIWMDCPRMGGDGPDDWSAPERPRVQRKRRKKKVNEPSMKDTILLVITVLALVLALSGAEMLTNLDPHPLAGCICLALGGTWITLICFVNSEAGKDFLEDVRCLK